MEIPKLHMVPTYPLNPYWKPSRQQLLDWMQTILEIFGPTVHPSVN